MGDTQKPKAKEPSATNIHTKLLEFHAKNISISKEANNPHFKSKYANLAEVIGKVRPALTEIGIVLVQEPGEHGLTTKLIDPETDTSVEGFLPYIGANDPQKLGSNLTYLRRYSLVTMLGLEDDDDDGNVASSPEKNGAAKPAPRAPARAPQETTPTIPMTMEEAFAELRKQKTVPGLEAAYVKLTATLKNDPEVIAVAGEVKRAIINKS